jgi:hypothetical protein
MTEFSHGKFIRIIILILTVTILTTAGAGSVQINIKDMPDQGIQLIPSSNARFGALLKSFTPSVQEDETIRSAKPYSALLINGSGRTIVAYAVRYLWVGFDGKTTFHDILTQSIRGNTDLRVAPNDFAIITPSLFIGRSHPSPWHPKHGGMAGPRESDVKSTLGQIALQAAITISLDAVVFEDGSFVGADETHAFARLTARIEQPRILMKEVLARYTRGDSEQSIFEFVKGFIADDPKDFSNVDSINWAHAMRTNAARSIMSVYERSGVQEAIKYAQREADLEVFTLVRR